MIKLSGRIRARYKGEYTTRQGEVKDKIVYEVIDDNGAIDRVTDFDCVGNPYSIDEYVDIPLYISTYMRDGKAHYNLVAKSDEGGRLKAF